MSDVSATLPLEPPAPVGPSPFSRVGLVFSAPSKAFALPGLASSWWAPYLVIVLISLGLAVTVGHTVGWETVSRNTLATNAKRQAQFSQATPDQQAQQIAIIARITRVSTYVAPAIGTLILAAMVAGLFLATFNFGLGGHAGFGQLFAVYLLSSLPQVIKSLLVILLLALGVGHDTFLLNNPLGSNIAYYLLGSGTSPVLIAILTWFDVFLIWQIVLLVIGCSMVAKVSRGKAAGVVIGWVVFFILLTGGLAAI